MRYGHSPYLFAHRVHILFSRMEPHLVSSVFPCVFSNVSSMPRVFFMVCMLIDSRALHLMSIHPRGVPDNRRQNVRKRTKKKQRDTVPSQKQFLVLTALIIFNTKKMPIPPDQKPRTYSLSSWCSTM